MNENKDFDTEDFKNTIETLVKSVEGVTIKASELAQALNKYAKATDALKEKEEDTWKI